MRHTSIPLVLVAIALLGSIGTVPTYAATGPGDLNCDNIVNYADIDWFVAALGCAGGDPACWPHPCPWIQADCNGDGQVNYADIDAFVALIGTTYEPGAITMLQLAGNPLLEYPYFEYVMAFNENAPIAIAVDPTRYPQFTGLTGDVYIVESRTPSGWDADPSLVDETPNGALTLTFDGTTILDNTFTITAPYDLDSAVFVTATGDYTGLGHGYDVVIDFNQNGILDAGDCIDGYSREAGLYVVHDTTQPGPLAVTKTESYNVGPIFGIPSYYTNQLMYYPTDIQDMDPLPLIMVGHGGGHNYQWYDHIGYHMASYGYIVVSHENCYGPPDCTLGHTDAVFELQDVIADGAVSGKIDASRIIWIGHSLGGMGVVGAVDTILDSEYTPTHYALDSIVLVSAMLPNAMGGPGEANPHYTNFHLWTAAGDTDISGAPYDEQLQTFLLHDRATNYRMSTILQGTGHAWFHDGPAEPSYFTGPCSIGRENTHLIQLGLFLPLIKYYAEGNIPATDFFWRQYERFHPIGVPVESEPCIVVTNEYRNGNPEGNFFIDDYQTNLSPNLSSSGGAVTFTVSNLLEGRLSDAGDVFTWGSGDPFNGATHALSSDSSRGVVFDWNGADAYCEWSIVPEACDFSTFTYFSFRGAQGTRHPFTTAALGDLTFTVSLIDGSGTSSTISIGAYGGGLEEPYQRTGSGTGTGWHDDFEVIRMRLTDFLTGGSGLNLANITAVRFDFGPSWGAPEGRIVLDELLLTSDVPPYFVPLTMRLADPLPPEFISPNEPTTIDLVIAEGNDTIIAGSALLHYRFDGGAWLTSPLVRTSGDVWTATLPAPACGQLPEYYFSVEGAATGLIQVPQAGAASPYHSFVGVYVSAFYDNFETDQGWTVFADPSLTSGIWQRTAPTSDGSYGEPTEDYDGSGRCLLTEDGYHRDVDYGPTWVMSPSLDLSGLQNPVLRFVRWVVCDDVGTEAQDFLQVELSDDDGATWTLAESIPDMQMWIESEIIIADYVDLTSQVRIRFWINDTPNNSKTEAAVDALEIFDVTCP